MTEPRDSYSPERRTALLLSGTGVDGAYHAGVLRALHEAAVKIDIAGGRGVGVIGAVMTAVDGGARLWEPDGLWRRPRVARFYRWRWPIRLVRWAAIALVAVFAAPVAVVAVGLVAYPVALAVGMAGGDAGAGLIRTVLAGLAAAFAPGALPTWIPRLATVLAGATFAVLVLGAWVASRRAPLRRRRAGGRGWDLLGDPIDAHGAVQQATDVLWRLLKGGAALKTPASQDLSQRYTDLLADNLGQPGFRELLLVVHDLDARRDLVCGLLRDPYRKALFPPPGGLSMRRAEAHDLSSGTGPFTVDVLAAALSVPGITAPQLVRFAPDAYWRGETHRITDRPSSIGRLLEEAAAAGAEQAIVVCAAADPPGPHELLPARRDGFGRIGEQLASTDSAAVADAVRHLHHRFQGVYLIRPLYNPLRALDLSGAYDERSDRTVTVVELMERGYEDAYRQFIEPVLGASGDRMTQVRDDDAG